MLKSSDIKIKNKKASFNYELFDRYIAGIQLFGTEIKSIRAGKASLVDSFCYFENGELWVKNMNIAEYRWGSFFNHDARRERKLLLTAHELKKLMHTTQETGYTIVPTMLFVNEKGLAKMEIALARGKKSYDKRQSLREKDDKRIMSRAMKNK